MQLTPLQIVTQFAHVLQQELFPELETAVGPLDKKLELLTVVVAMTPLGRRLIGPPLLHRPSGKG